MDNYCEHCGSKTVKYKVQLNKALAKKLINLRRLEVLLSKKEIWVGHDDKGTEFDMSANQSSNMSRLRLLGLARYTESHSGLWFITRRGYAFLCGGPVPKYVWVYRNRIVEDMRTDEVITLTKVFSYGNTPYFEPVVDQQPVTEQERAVHIKLDMKGGK